MNKKIKVLFVCHGNICRSPMAQSVFQYLVEQNGIADRFVIDSAATSTEEIGSKPHHMTSAELKKRNIPIVPHYARQITKADGNKFDYIIGMDSANVRNISGIIGEKKVCRIMEFAGQDRDVADPWYTGDFVTTYEDIRLGCEKLLEKFGGEL